MSQRQLMQNNSPAAAGVRPRNVLFVSADPDLRAAVSRVLEREQYRVHAVAHSGHALLACRTSEFDVAITELISPDLSGPVLATQLRRHHPQLSVIFLGTPGSPENVQNLLVRPFTREALLERLEHAVNGQAC